MDERPYASVATVGFVVAVISAVIYFMNLSIFSSEVIQWIFVLGLISAGSATVAAILKQVWQNRSNNY